MRSERSHSTQPFKLLGGQIKSVRENAKETLPEVSGAVEVDLDIMLQYENGEARPSEEVLLLLISHFDISDNEATKLWELAGYNEDEFMVNDMDSEPKKYVGSNILDLRIAYTDMIHVVANNQGVVMNFMQGSGPNGQPLIVSRLGMSQEHAKGILELLRETLEQVDKKDQPKRIASSKVSKKTDTN